MGEGIPLPSTFFRTKHEFRISLTRCDKRSLSYKANIFLRNFLTENSKSFQSKFDKIAKYLLISVNMTYFRESTTDLNLLRRCEECRHFKSRQDIYHDS